VITAGDLAGISGTILLKALNNPQIKKINPTIYGDFRFLNDLKSKYIKEFNLNDFELPIQDSFNFGFSLDILANPSPITGNAAGKYFEKAINDAIEGKIDAIVTAPLNKDYLQQGGFNFTGHTSMIQHYTKTKDVVMMLYGDKLKVALLTIHIPLKEVANKITIESIINNTVIVNNEMKSLFNIKEPKIALLSLNPHAGENGKLGKEELEIYIPAMNILKEKGIKIEGPFPSDTFFYKNYKNYDVTIASYHDQGLIPLKMLHFDDGVNITLNLPIIRTSVDHGTAYDIAKTFTASENSLVYAILEAYRMSMLK